MLKKAVKKFPGCVNCFLELAGIDMRIQDLSSALDALDHAVAAAPAGDLRSTALLFRGTLLSAGDKKQLAQAEKDLRDALAQNPKLLEARFRLGIALVREEHEPEGLAEILAYLNATGAKENEEYARKVLAKPHAARETLAPDFKVPTADGAQFSLAANAGKIVVIDFWATWCPPCRESVPEIKEMLKKYPSDKLVVLSASADNDEEAWHSFIDKTQMSWPQYWDRDGRLAEIFGVHAFPTYIVIDRDGFIRKRLVGMNPRESIAHKLREELQSVLE